MVNELDAALGAYDDIAAMCALLVFFGSIAIAALTVRLVR